MIIGNASFIECFTKKLCTNSSSISIVIGPSQSGKTHICSEVFNKNNFDVHKIPTDIQNTKELAKLMEPHRDVVSISSMFCMKKKVLFLDDFDIYGSDSAFQSYLINFKKHKNFELAKMHFVVVLCVTKEKNFKSLIQKLEVFRIQNPPKEESLEYVMSLNPELNKDTLLPLCEACDGNIGILLSRVQFIKNCKYFDFVLQDKSMYDIIDMLYKKKIPESESDLLYSYDPRLLSMIYLDNMHLHDCSVENRLRLVSHMSDYHIIDESLPVTYDHSITTHMWSKMLCNQPLLCCNGKDKKNYKFTTILNKTVQRCIYNRNIYTYLSDLKLDQCSREVYFDLMFDLLLIHGKKYISNDSYVLCKTFIQNIGEIKKEYLDKLI